MKIKSKKFPKSLKTIILSGILGLAVFGGIKGCTKINQISKEGKIQYNSTKSLINKCMSKAAGEDYVLDFAEGIELAKQLGYEGQISPGGYIKLTQCGKHAHLWVGRKKEHTPISVSQLENYLNSEKSLFSKEEKDALNSKYAYNQTDINKKYKKLGVGVRFNPLTGKPDSLGISIPGGIYDPGIGMDGYHEPGIKVGPTIDF